MRLQADWRACRWRIARLLGVAVVFSGACLAVTAQTAVGLQGALAAVMEHNPRIAAKRYALTSARLRVQEAQAGRLPSVTVQAQRVQSSDDMGLLRIRQPLWAFGRMDDVVALAEARESLGRLQSLAEQRQLLEETAVAYVQVWGLRQRLEAAQDNVDEHERLLAMIERRRDGGVASDADAWLARSRGLAAVAVRDQIRTALDTAERDLAALTVVAVTAGEPLRADWETGWKDHATPAVAQHAEATVQVRQAELHVAQRSAAQTRSAGRPTVYAQIDRDLGHQSSGSSSRSLRAGVVLEAQIDHMGAASRWAQEAELALVDAASKALEWAVEDAGRRVSSLAAQHEAQARLRDAYEGTMQAASRILESYLRQFDAGRKQWLDVLNAVREVADARQQLETARMNAQLHSVRLAATTGQLDVLAGVQP